MLALQKFHSYESPSDSYRGPLRRGLQTCEVVSSPDTVTNTVYSEEFSGSSTGSFIPYPGSSVSLSNVSQKLKIEAIWTSQPRATSPDFNVVSGKIYELNVDIDDISVGTGKTHKVRIRIYYPGGNIYQDFTSTGTATMTFTPSGTGTAKVEFLSIITPSTGGYSPGNPYITIDNFIVSYDSTFTSYDTICSTSSNKYRYGFNGMEKVNEIAGEGNDYDFGGRIYDGRLGRWFSVDPYSSFKSFITPYVGIANNPNVFVDNDGNDEILIIYLYSSDGTLLKVYKISVSEKKNDYYKTQIFRGDIGFDFDYGFFNIFTIHKFTLDENGVISTHECEGSFLGLKPVYKRHPFWQWVPGPIRGPSEGEGDAGISGGTRLTSENGGVSPSKTKSLDGADGINIGDLLTTLGGIGQPLKYGEATKAEITNVLSELLKESELVQVKIQNEKEEKSLNNKIEVKIAYRMFEGSTSNKGLVVKAQYFDTVDEIETYRKENPTHSVTIVNTVKKED